MKFMDMEIYKTAEVSYYCLLWLSYVLTIEAGNNEPFRVTLSKCR